MYQIYERRLRLWRPYWNRDCGVLVLPYMIRWFDLAWWRWWLPFWWRNRWDD